MSRGPSRIGRLVAGLIAAGGIAGPVSVAQVSAQVQSKEKAATAIPRDNVGTKAMRLSRRGGSGLSDVGTAYGGVPSSFNFAKRGTHGKQSGRGSWRNSKVRCRGGR